MLFENSLDIEKMVVTLESKGLSSLNLYILGMLYWIFINSLLEEYVFRWFITTKGSILFRSESMGILFSAMLFTLHHSLALHFFGFIWWQTVIASFGLLTAAAIWSWLYIKYKSIWVCWLSHAICDVVVFTIGYLILFT
jgi:membrane protease YdiL (CAAX protease family)